LSDYPAPCITQLRFCLAPPPTGPLKFCGFAGPLVNELGELAIPSGFRRSRIESTVRNSIHQSRRLAWRIVAWQFATAIVTAAFWLIAGQREALAAFLGGGLVALGSMIFALRFFPRRQPDAGVVLTRLVVSTALKWFVVIGGLGIVLGRLQMAPLPVLTGLVAALLVNLVSLRFSD
jgi:ATP synthase protein I